MPPLDLAEVVAFIHAYLGPQFHDKKIGKIQALTLDDIIRRKNPYLFRAKGSNSAHEFIKSILDATVSSGEETTFGNFLENLAIFVCEKVYKGRKSGVVGLDLEFEDRKTKYLVSIKSGPNWGNSGQVKHLVKNFTAAKKTLATSGGAVGMNIICVEACCYGVDNTPDKGTHLKLCGQRCWELLSGGNETLYRDIIKPLGQEAKERNDKINLLFSEKLNVFTAAFVERFCDEGLINWDRLIQFNSGKS
jgi:Type II restriction endonuclease EcoO109I